MFCEAGFVVRPLYRLFAQPKPTGAMLEGRQEPALLGSVGGLRVAVRHVMEVGSRQALA
jgi:hypothetical protein